MYGLFGDGGMQCGSPVGHFTGNFWTATNVGFGAIKEQAEAKVKQLEEDGIFGESIDQYNFYRAVAVVCDGMITLTKRYAKLAEEKAKDEKNPKRKKELEKNGGSLELVYGKSRAARSTRRCRPCTCIKNCMCLDACMHGISYGRVDQYLGKILRSGHRRRTHHT